MSTPSSTTFKSFAVVGGLSKGPIGAGIGVFFAKALKKEGAEVKVLTRASSVRSSSLPSCSVRTAFLSRLTPFPSFFSPQINTPAAKKLTALGIAIVEVDNDSPSSLVSALQGVDVILSSVAGGGFAAQVPLAAAGKEAGVKLFIPR